MLGAATILKKHEKDFNWIINLVFQPAEETSTIYDPKGSGGAGPMTNERPDLFKHDAALALHVVASTIEDEVVGNVIV